MLGSWSCCSLFSRLAGWEALRGAMSGAKLEHTDPKRRRPRGATDGASWRTGSDMTQLPLSNQVIFSDWHGVLSHDPFWVTIQRSARHPLHHQLQTGLAGVFASDKETANEWMKGLLSSEQIIEEMGIQLPGNFKDDFLERSLDLDCAKMKVNVELFEILRVVRAQAMVVIATDNMDCFIRAFERARRRQVSRINERETLADWALICDDIICSSLAGTLKSEDPKRFFGPWLARYDMTFGDAMLIDDRADNCAAFTAQGGVAIQWKMGVNDIGDVADRLKNWINLSLR
jgi:hypothetical protein